MQGKVGEEAGRHHGRSEVLGEEVGRQQGRRCWGKSWDASKEGDIKRGGIRRSKRRKETGEEEMDTVVTNMEEA